MIEVNNLTRRFIDKAFLRKVALGVLKKEGKEAAEVSVALVGSKRAAALNKKYRKKDTVANVLSFPAGNERIPSEGKEYLGEIVLCPQQVQKEAGKYGMIFKEALAWMFIHGLLHLLGYDHEQAQEAKQMEQKEHWYLSRVKNLNLR
ncbi:MAG: rRNA maturation RNase YbeY [Candidatus Wildermuthbacteria bacterium]|nr:rRNA maturation RNase YbeY [Candidatus Wildermuthbacteria bacterium]